MPAVALACCCIGLCRIRCSAALYWWPLLPKPVHDFPRFFFKKKKKGHHHTAMHLQSCSIGRRESLVTVTHGLGALRLTATPQFFLLSKVSSFHWRRKCSWFCFFFSSICFNHKCVLCIFLYVSVQAPRVISWCPCFVQMGIKKELWKVNKKKWKTFLKRSDKTCLRKKVKTKVCDSHFSSLGPIFFFFLVVCTCFLFRYFIFPGLVCPASLLCPDVVLVIILYSVLSLSTSVCLCV